ncbi:MAG TPA: hypothetical protein VLD37_01070 [Candidatus Bilamarchaeum sp.]|nr:hypothetical protein [Candidatus Bilamarchaeum sp.]
MREISLDEAKPVWDRFVPEKQVWTDDWDIRVALCREFGYKPLILYDGKNFFPLQFEPEGGYYSIMGGATAEKNYLTFDPEFMKTTKQIPENIYFDFLDERFDGCLEGLCPQFFIDLTNINGIDDYLKRFSGKHQKNFRNSCRQFGSYEFMRKGTLKEMAALNILVFGEKSDFATGDPGDSACYDILDRDPRTEYWSLIKDGETASILQYFFYGRTMSVCLWGVDSRYKDTRKVVLAEEIKLAKSRGCTRIDYAPTYSGWKFLYRLDTAPLWRYKRGPIPDSVDTADYGVPPDELKRLKSEGRL